MAFLPLSSTCSLSHLVAVEVFAAVELIVQIAPKNVDGETRRQGAYIVVPQGLMVA